MGESSLLEVTGDYYDKSAVAAGALNRQRPADVSVDLIGIARRRQFDLFNRARSEISSLLRRHKALLRQDLTSRGFANTSILPTELRGLEEQYRNSIHDIGRHHSQVIDRIDLLEKEVREIQAKKLDGRIRRSAVTVGTVAVKAAAFIINLIFGLSK